MFGCDGDGQKKGILGLWHLSYCFVYSLLRNAAYDVNGFGPTALDGVRITKSTDTRDPPPLTIGHAIITESSGIHKNQLGLIIILQAITTIGIWKVSNHGNRV